MLSAISVNAIDLFPENNSTEVNPDTHLVLAFDSKVTVGNKGFIKIFDNKTGELVDVLDMSIPAGPTIGQPVNPDATYTTVPYKYVSKKINNVNTIPGTPSGINKKDTSRFQRTIIGGFSDGFHFYPVIVHENKATIYLHNNILEYGHSYYVIIDDGVITTADGHFHGLKDKANWVFTTKDNAPTSPDHFLMVSNDGEGDFNTVQGALDFIPDFINDSTQAWNIWIQNGDYEELVYFRNKQYVTIEGESRDSVIIHYANNEVFNPHPADIKTNELKGTFPSRRAAFAADNCSYMEFRNLTLKTDLTGQAEGFLLNGDHNIIENVHVIGSGDALQANGSAYWLNCIIDGGGDTVLGRGPSFFDHCTLSSYGAFLWIRNTNENHGDVFLNCTFRGLGPDAVIARSPINKGKGYPYAEAVLINCTQDKIPAIGWGPIEGDTTNVHFWEYASRNPDGSLTDVSQRHPVSKQLNATKDQNTIVNYSKKEFVLGW
jgi:pectin methylesterase-like acyl-CoA thioesterase